MVAVTPMTLAGFDPVMFFRKLRESESSPSYMTSGAWIIIAWDPAETMAGRDVSVLTRVKTLQKKYRTSSQKDFPFLGGVLGWISYDAGMRLHGVSTRHKKSLSIPDVCCHRYPHALLFDGKKVFAVGSAHFRKKIVEIHSRPLPLITTPSLDWESAMTRQAYTSAFTTIKKRIVDGDVYQLNYSYPFTAQSSLDARQLFCDLLRHSPAPAAAYLEYGRSALLSLSPERFVRVRRGRITTCPIKGTRPRGLTPAEDRRHMRALLKDPKESAELSMITDLLRNDIGQVAVTGSVRVKGFRLLQKNPSVWHTYSVIEGRLLPKIHPLDAFLSMFPGGSVTGCPKIAAMEEIDRIEAQSRGLYCGSVLLLSDDGHLDSTIIIRSIEKAGTHLKLGVGGGIVADSVCENEEDETLQKAARILSRPTRQTWVNGRASADHPLLPLLDPKHASVRGVFETMRYDGRRLRDRTLHWKRLLRSAKHTGFVISEKTQRDASQYLSSVVTQLGSTPKRVKIVLTGKDVLIEARPLIADPATAAGVSVTVTKLTRHSPEAKALPYHREWRSYTDAVAQGFHEALLLGADGTIREAALSNLFMVKRGMLYTAADGMLAGITRAHVLRCAKKLAIPVKLIALTRADLYGADEVFLTRSTVGIIPVSRIQKRKVGKGTVGTITKRLSATLHS